MKNYLHRRPVISSRVKKNADSARTRKSWRSFWGGLIFAFFILAVLVLPSLVVSRWGPAWQFWGNVVIRWAFAVAAFGGALIATRLTLTRKLLPGLAIGLVLILLSGGFDEQANVRTSLSGSVVLVGGGTLGGILCAGREMWPNPRAKPARSRRSINRRDRPV
ncbi:MAG: hypothetical protein PHC60_00275 [Heliobacteriaceae bacterium]|nr:hypothetical protein [Heliobacteriaceae bacterium]MDD4586817.1 hypothetical protein [Heliobacteriaceae bacterium]